ncbi:efflux RND transporter permease subunit [Anabaena cylindrica FACHB-243]|uniref:Acriflavin resistance protein n=1 Tax=Anabaena cylindrica (strain ATCC 27899 / PCC 7122) TaxID=272123 RepID=K9ZRT1_ANACC|nr:MULTISPECIES: efflux RND transporter permease subunit [Anabaena]AFZ61217.1 acriflavin resistance protein [Anabaena cylindrica PCC 7122]MBD2421693.1 efflux RND transporter permease subunit [Anabaena cylindrica FACHB-243]MBY5280550.1 MMPL family transporter [Anabaena sp. CCAP 1446/1C]MBY5308139.1 MMPL family transporter [Anabaena sp. CCAP 1446/1C]MCM2405404.1 efflux RND transporter permease subunit [Anabaena sp. CCAP 1446/1C]
MFANFFIKRPVFAIVCALVMLMVGIISIPILPVEQYPDISPVQINVTANYIGANAQVVEETVTTVLERQINGIEGLKYITSTSSSDGTSNITITFDQGYDIDTAAADVQNRVLLAEPKLPEVVRQTGVSVTKQSSGIVLAMAMYSEGDKYDDTFISNYADLYVLDRLRRIKGVGNIATFGDRRYAMRLWLDPTQLANRKLTTEDVINALHQQNLQLGIGSIGQPPAPNGQMYQIELQTQGRLKEADEFANIVIKAGTDGTIVKLKDVGRAELGAENYSSFARYSGNVAVGYQILQIPGSNALKIANAVKAEMEQIAKDFPPGLKYEFPYDSSLFVEASRQEVVKNLLESIALVVLVIFVFLQDWRTTLIPAITIPISLIGTFALKLTTGPQTINHYNLYRSIEINGAAAPGFSSGQAIETMKNLAASVLPKNMSYEWSGITLEELESGGQAPIIFGLGIFFVFLVLAAQYNNFIDPLIILLSVPLAVLGALLAQSWRGLYNDVYCQVGLVMLIGLASKNAILIVEFANQLREEGFSITKAAVKASSERLRPIIMTAISTLLGTWPLVVATGAGSASRQSLGTAVFGGMFFATFLSLFVVPILYIMVTQISSLFTGLPKIKTPQRELIK